MRWAAAFAALLAAACDAQSPAGNAPAANRQEAAPPPPPAPTAQTLRPGQWETVQRVLSIEPVEATPEIAARIRAQPLPEPEVERSCLTPEGVANPIEAYRQMLVQGEAGTTCEPAQGTFADGRIRFTLVCRNAAQAEVRQAMVGTYTAETIQLAASAQMATPVPGAAAPLQLHVESTLTSRRVGECPAGGDAAN